MHSIKLDHWYINDNNLSISLMRFYVGIKCIIEDNKVVYNLELINSEIGLKKLFRFSCLEDAIFFTEEVIRKCQTFEEVNEEYNNMYESNGKVMNKTLWK